MAILGFGFAFDVAIKDSRMGGTSIFWPSNSKDLPVLVSYMHSHRKSSRDLGKSRTRMGSYTKSQAA